MTRPRNGSFLLFVEEDVRFEVQAVMTTIVIAAMIGTATCINLADGLMARSR